jgi:hypothetical protein
MSVAGSYIRRRRQAPVSGARDARPALAGHLVAIDEARPSVRSRTSLRAAPRQAGDEAIPSELEPPEADRALETIDASTDNAPVGDRPLSR